MNLNKVFIIGRLAADPESRTTPNGQTVVRLRVATNRVWNDRQTREKREQVEFHTISAWGGIGEVAAKYLRKGQLAMFEGRLQTRSWQGQDGVKRYATEIVADGLQLGPKAAGTGNYQSNNSVSNNSVNSTRVNPVKSGGAGAKQFDGVKEEEIPVINEDEPVSSDPIISDGDIEEKEIDLKDIPF